MRSPRRPLCLAALGWTVLVLVGPGSGPAAAQRTSTLYRVGVLNDARAANHPAAQGLKAGLGGAGFQEGRDVIFDVKLTDGSAAGMLAAARALVQSRVNVIFTSGEAATLAARAATPTIPIVFTLVGDPVAAGVVRSLSRPEGNVTGVSSRATELVPKRLEVLKTLDPSLRRVWAICDGADPGAGAAQARALEASPRLGLQIAGRTIRTPDDLEHIIDSLRAGDGVLVPDVAALDVSARLLEASLARRIPALFSSKLWVSHGGLVSYGADYRAQGEQGARLVGKILRGAHPRDLPVEGAGHVILAINLRTVAAFGLAAPRQMLFRADVIRR